MEKVLFLLATMCAIHLQAQDVINGEPDERLIVLSQTQAPKPHRLVDEPEVWYNHSTGIVYIQLDAAAYSEYTVYLTATTGTSSVQPTTPVVAVPGDLARRLTYLLIDSDEVGTYEATMSINTGSTE